MCLASSGTPLPLYLFPKAVFPVTNIDELKSTGLKATLPRLKILEVFQRGTQRHL